MDINLISKLKKNRKNEILILFYKILILFYKILIIIYNYDDNSNSRRYFKV